MNTVSLASRNSLISSGSIRPAPSLGPIETTQPKASPKRVLSRLNAIITRRASFNSSRIDTQAR